MMLLVAHTVCSLRRWWYLLFVVLWTLDGVVTLDQCDIDVFIQQSDLPSSLTPNEGERYSIISGCVNMVDVYGYVPLEGTNKTLPSLPSTVDSVTVYWRSNDTETSYKISVADDSVTNTFQSINFSIPEEGRINDHPEGFTISFPCLHGSFSVYGIINITVQLNSTSLVAADGNSSSSLLSANFLLRKDCTGASQSNIEEGSGADESLLPYVSSVAMDTIGSVTFVPFPSESLFPFSSSTDSFLIPQTTTTLSTLSLITTTSSINVPIDTTESVTATPSLLITRLANSGSPGPTVDTGPPWLLFVVIFGPIAGFLTLCIVIIVCCLCVICCVKCNKRKPLPTTSGFFDNPDEIVHRAYDDVVLDLEDDKYKKESAPVSLWSTSPWGQVVMLPLHIQKMIKTVNIDRRKLTITNTFLRVENGCLNHGLLLMDSSNPMSVLNQGAMLKMSTGENCQREEVLKFVEQALSLQGLEHTHILPILGMSVEDNCVPIAIYPIVEYGNLHSFLELGRVSPESCPLNPFGEEYKANFGLQLAAAIKFLNEKGLTHQDIALRNCWLDNGYVVKLSDGALSQEFHPDAYSTIKGAMRPVKWSALETLQEGLMTAQSNIWSFGVLLWEIFSMAQTPYPDVPNGSIISHLMMGERLPKPDECLDEIYDIMTECWRVRGEERPHITTIEDRLKDISTRLPSLVFPKGTAPFSPKANDLTYSTFLPTTDGRQPMPVVMEENPYIHDTTQSSTRHSGTSMLSDVILRRASGGKKRSSGHLSSTSVTRSNGGDHLSLSFSILSGNDDSSTSSGDSDNEADGSFPSTLRSTKSTNTGTATDSQACSSGVGGAGSISTLQQPSPLGMYPPVETSDIASKTSTMDDSVSARSSVLLQPTNQSTSGTDRSSFYSTGIDSVSTTFSTPLPNSTPANNTPSIELKTYSGNEDSALTRSRPMETSSASPFTGKSTDSGIRSDEETSVTPSYKSDPMRHPPPDPPAVSLRHPPPEPPASRRHPPPEPPVASPKHPQSNPPGVVLRHPPPEPPADVVSPRNPTPNGTTPTSNDSNHLQPSNSKDSKSAPRDSSKFSRTSFGLGLSDMSSDLMAAFEQFSFN